MARVKLCVSPAVPCCGAATDKKADTIVIIIIIIIIQVPAGATAQNAQKTKTTIKNTGTHILTDRKKDAISLFPLIDRTRSN